MSRIAVALNQKYEREPIEAHGSGTAGAYSSGRPPSSRAHRNYGKDQRHLNQKSYLKRWSVEMSVAEMAVLDKVSKSKSGNQNTVSGSLTCPIWKAIEGLAKARQLLTRSQISEVYDADPPKVNLHLFGLAK